LRAFAPGPGSNPREFRHGHDAHGRPHLLPAGSGSSAKLDGRQWGAAHRNDPGGVAHIIMQAGWSFGLFASLFAEFSGTRGSKSIGAANHEIPTHDRIAR
jgi:hypothetical protein